MINMILIGCFIALLYCSMMLVRNHYVLIFRSKLIEIVFHSDISYKLLLVEFNSIDYDTMVNQFWRPLTIKEFYSHTTHLKNYTIK